MLLIETAPPIGHPLSHRHIPSSVASLSPTCPFSTVSCLRNPKKKHDVLGVVLQIQLKLTAILSLNFSRLILFDILILSQVYFAHITDILIKGFRSMHLCSH